MMTMADFLGYFQGYDKINKWVGNNKRYLVGYPDELTAIEQRIIADQ